AADIAAVLTERGLGGDDVDLTHRVEAFRRDRSRRASDARAMAKRWSELASVSQRGRSAPSPLEGEGWGGGSDSRSRRTTPTPHSSPQGGGERSSAGTEQTSIGSVLSLAYPDRIAKNRGNG